MRLVLVVTAVIVGVGLLGRGLTGGGARPVVLDVPPAGQAQPTELPDGTPVFVSHEADGDIHVVDAVNPHRFRGLTTLVAWCPPAGAFEDSLDGSRFDAAGQWLFGPAPHDLGTYETTSNGAVVLVGARQPATARTPARDPAVRRWCVATAGTLATNGEVLTLDSLVSEPVTHAPDTMAELLALPGEPVQWCDGIQATVPPRCARTLATMPSTSGEHDLPWSWKGPVRGEPRDPASLQLIAGGQEEYPARGSLTRVFGSVLRLSTVADTLRLTMNRKIIFGDFFTTARPLELGEPVPSLWKMGDRDGPVIATYTLPPSFTEDEARDLVGELVDMVVASNSRILSIDLLPRADR